MTNVVDAERVLYIKLGSGGQWERECLERSQTLRLGFGEVSHAVYTAGDWAEAHRRYMALGKTQGKATEYVTQIRHFYESDERTLWITFHGGRLWWCFSAPTITALPDATKTRTALSAWRSDDIHSRPLLLTGLSGKVTSLQGYRGTICTVREARYVLQRINGQQPPEVARTQDALAGLVSSVEAVIQRLTWQDFETLTDLIFRGAGWQRLSETGGKQKTLDLDLISPLTQEKIAVQVKSWANLAAFREYQERFADMQGYSRCYFVVHTPDRTLTPDAETEDLTLWTGADIARLTVRYGLTEWVLEKAG